MRYTYTVVSTLQYVGKPAKAGNLNVMSEQKKKGRGSMWLESYRINKYKHVVQRGMLCIPFLLYFHQTGLFITSIDFIGAEYYYPLTDSFTFNCSIGEGKIPEVNTFRTIKAIIYLRNSVMCL